jgi:enolase
MKIVDIRAFEILTTQGTSSVIAKLTIEKDGDQYSYSASAAHGTSKSSHEAQHECSLEPSDEARNIPWFTEYQASINQAVLDIKKELVGKDLTAAEIDTLLCTIDGTKDKHRLGSSIILATSIAACRAEADSQEMSLAAYLSGKIMKDKGHFSVPIPLINIINGGKHVLSESVAIQEFLLCPAFDKEIRQDFHSMVSATQLVLKEIQHILQKRKIFFAYGAEGGIAAQWNSVEQVFDTIMQALQQHKLEKYFTLGIDCAASTWYNKQTNMYQFAPNGKKYTSDQLASWYKSLIARYPISIIEDPFAEDDFEAWKAFRPSSFMLVGDDITATHTSILEREDITDLINAVMVKPDQVGTVTETIEFIKKAKEKGLDLVLSRRSAETEDPFIADLSIAAGQAFCKFGNITQGSISKYNHLLNTISEIVYEMDARGEFDKNEEE